MSALFVVALIAVLAVVALVGRRGDAAKSSAAAAELDSPEGPAQPIWLEGNGRFAADIVGESHYQDALERICGGKTDASAKLEVDAELVPEDENAHDDQAVAVRVQGELVGYLSRNGARAYRRRMLELGLGGREASCRARIIGGWRRERRGVIVDEAMFGVKLDLA